MSTLRRPRWATPADNDALIALNRACPMQGAIAMYFDRAPDFFALSRLQGAGAQVCVIDGPEPGKLSAIAAMASLPAVYVDGEPRQVFYAGDLRVDPAERGGRMVKRIYDHLTAWGKDQGWSLGVTSVMASNEAMRAVLAGKGGVVPYMPAGIMRNYTVQFVLPKRRVPGVTVRPATDADLPAMVALWNQLQRGKQFAPVWDEAERRAWLEAAPGVGIGDYRLAFRGDRLVALSLAWDQEAFKRMVVLDYDAAMTRMKRWYNPLARLLGLCPIPPVGARLPYFYATHLCAETPEDLRALLTALYNERRGRDYLFFSVMLDVADPLSQALDGFTTQHVDIALYAMDGLRQFEGHDFRTRPAYFDPAIV